MLIRLVYASTAQSGVNLDEFKRILLQAQANNHRRDLTGMLAFNSKIFLQALEGSRDEINDLYAKLIRDPRHKTVTLLNYKEIEERHWANWSMGFAAPNTDNRALFLKYSQQSVFNPYSMKAEAVEKLLMELASTAIAMNATADAASATVAPPAAAAAAAAWVNASQPESPTASAPVRRSSSSFAPLAPALAAMPSTPAVPRSASAPASVSSSSAMRLSGTQPAPLTSDDRAAVAKSESVPASGLFARFLNK